VDFLTDPSGWWIEPFTTNGFMRNALIVGLLAVVSTSVVGTWVVLRGMSFLGDALAHGVLPGVAVAFVIGVNTTIGAFAAATLMVGGISLVRKYSPLPEDTSIGLLFVGFLAFAIVIMSGQSGSYTGDLNRFLFGSITGVDNGDIRRQAIAAFVTVAAVAVFYRAFLAMTFNRTQAQLFGLRPGLSHMVLLMILAGSIVASFEAVGNLLVFAFLISPPATASMLVRRVPMIMGLAVILGSAAVIIGLLLSYHHNTAAGATMALTSVIGFFIVLLLHAFRQALSEAEPAQLLS
jgi:ABC-type Mn2+/Zn2+ transport system permease subunit